MSNRASDLTKWFIAEFKANIETPIYNGIAPEGTCHPFVTFSIIADNPKKTTCDDKGTYQIQLSVYDSLQKLSNVHDIVDAIRDYFDNLQDVTESIQLVSYNNNFFLPDTENKGWQGILLYTIFMDEAVIITTTTAQPTTTTPEPCCTFRVLDGYSDMGVFQFTGLDGLEAGCSLYADTNYATGSINLEVIVYDAIDNVIAFGTRSGSFGIITLEEFGASGVSGTFDWQPSQEYLNKVELICTAAPD